jgi:predicted RNA binding protein with dsRBD fold (UPF0201 family)
MQRDALIASLDATALREQAAHDYSAYADTLSHDVRSATESERRVLDALNDVLQRRANIECSVHFHLFNILSNDTTRAVIARVLNAHFNRDALDSLRTQLEASMKRDAIVKMTRKTFYVTVYSRYADFTH